MDLVSQRSGLMGPLQDLPQGQKTASSCQDNNIPDGFVSSNSEASATTPTYGVGSRDWATATQSVFTDNKRTHILQLGFDVQQADINPRKPQYYPPRPPSSPSYSRHLPQSHPSARLLPPPLIHEKNCFLKSDFGLGKEKTYSPQPIEVQWRRVGVSIIGVFETGVFDTGVFDTGVFDTGVFDTGVFDTGVFDTGVFDTGVFDTGVFDTGVFDTGEGGQNYLGTGYGPGGQRAKATREVAMVLRERTTNLAQILEGPAGPSQSLLAVTRVSGVGGPAWRP
ncbi:hypothetical protein B0A52_07788 [Exophiala mesophila]|uniref:Uncharacterized protein n=1 Tax=Exophiala mesophila TaxID=212818 RepID=A0A438MXM5_EXOME|nr:hypothetical protein B0A52_07788 [Exophiala mesophila]